MKIVIRWQAPVQLTNNKKLLFDEDSIPAAIEARPGVYYFSRDFAGTLLPFYIGETLSVRHRLRDHLRRVKIVDVLRGQSTDHQIKNGRRYFHFGYLGGSPGKEVAKRRLKIVQHYMIRQAVAHELPMLNMSLTKIPTHQVQFLGNKRGRGEFQKFSMIEAR